jgi:hypothetical protein
VSFPVGRVVACDAQNDQYPVQSKVTAVVFRLFVSAVEGESIELMNEKVERLSALCAVLQFRGISPRVEAVVGRG